CLSAKRTVWNEFSCSIASAIICLATGPPPSQVLASLHLVKFVFPQFESIIIERTTKKPLYVSVACLDNAKEFDEQQLTPFYEHFKKHIEAVDATIRKEVAEYKQIFDDLDAEYERCVLENKNLKIEKKILLIKNDCLIAECLEKYICSIVLASINIVPPISDCMCADLRTSCDREHSKVLELEAEVLKRQHMLTESEKRCVFLENEHLKDQLQGKDETIRNLQAQHDIKTVIAKLKAKDVGNKSSGTTTPTNPKVLALGMYAIGIKSATGASKTAFKNHAWIYRKLPAKSTSGEKVEDHPRNLNKQNRVDSHLNAKSLVSISNLNAVCGAFHECLFSFNPNKCVVYSMNSVKPKATPNR
nr:hypothetical protein [Tanacetum cinerariifolium]